MSNEIIQPGMFISQTCSITDSDGKRPLADEHLTLNASIQKVREVLSGEVKSSGMHASPGLPN